MQTSSQGCRKSLPYKAQSVFLIILAAVLSLSNDSWIRPIAGLYVSVPLLILPFGIICP